MCLQYLCSETHLLMMETTTTLDPLLKPITTLMVLISTLVSLLADSLMAKPLLTSLVSKRIVSFLCIFNIKHRIYVFFVLVPANMMGLPSPPAYADPNTVGNRILQGVNYASAAAGILDETGQNYVIIFPTTVKNSLITFQ